ncbi:methionyl-tRNA formyltransferase [Pseudanabaena sp. Chao 1811]|uniref:methionyl-tRNA formyltransferase n=1 Tax=Pseudanabaena sp. Chao 1811 TaxID=2963092 RepID=UPI0022F3B204|nr:formyltransferase family protein [Pseudanabaena sp. Chao 1811]
MNDLIVGVGAALMRIAIIGRTEILYETALLLRKNGYEVVLIFTAKESLEYTKTSSDFLALADEWKIPFICSHHINEMIDVMQDMEPINIGVSLNYTGIIPQSIIDLFSMGILNAHGGDLPRYRGNACQSWAILNGESYVGLCIHKMIGGEIDSGDIIARDYYPLTLNTKVTEVHSWMSEKIPQLFVIALQKLEKNPNYFLEQQSKEPRDSLRCYPRKPEDGRINWDKSNVEILRLINACNRPYAGAFCEFKSKKVIIWDAELAIDENFLAISGQITFIGADFIEVATGRGKLRIKEIEIEGQLKNPSLVFRSIRQRLS